jgi:hypothetical protein
VVRILLVLRIYFRTLPAPPLNVELLNEKDQEGSGRDVIEVKSSNLSGRDWRKRRETSGVIAGVLGDIRTQDLPI